MTYSVEILVLALTLVLWCLPALVVLLPLRECYAELFQCYVTRMSGCNLALLYSGWCSAELVPRNFAELDQLTENRAIQAARTHHPNESAAAAAELAMASATSSSSSIASSISSQQPLLVNSVVSLDDSGTPVVDSVPAALPTLAPLVQADQFSYVLNYDPRTRRLCLIEMALATLLLMFMMHTGQWTMHSAWQCAVYVLYCVPLIYWQFWCTLRPAFYVVTRDSSFEAAHTTLTEIEQMVIRAEYARYDYRADLQYYTQTSTNAEHCDPQRVDLFLRATNARTGRDRFCEFRLWVMCMQRREESDALRRYAMAQHIQEMFFYPHAPLPFLNNDPFLFTVLMDGSYSMEDPRLFDTCLIGLAYDLDQRTDKAQILESLQAVWKAQDARATQALDAARHQLVDSHLE